jgi:iron complex outermembrane recepter protein
VEFDWVLRYVSSLPSQNVSGYSTADVHCSWQPTSRLVLAIVGQNLMQPHHFEFNKAPTGTEVKRGIYGKATWYW